MSPISFPLESLAVERITAYPGRPTLVFLHDSLGCIAVWRDFPRQLGELTRCNVMVYDRQGYGKSGTFTKSIRDNDYLEDEAAILDSLLASYGISDALLFGHSDGGSVALVAAALYPSRIKAVITEGAHVFVEDVTLRGIEEAIVAYQQGDLKARLEPYHGVKTEALFWAWAGTWTSERFRSWSIEPLLPSIICPILVIQGEDDEYGTVAQVTKIGSQTTGPATAWLLPWVKHTPHKEVRELVLLRVSSFIDALTF